MDHLSTNVSIQNIYSKKPCFINLIGFKLLANPHPTENVACDIYDISSQKDLQGNILRTSIWSESHTLTIPIMKTIMKYGLFNIRATVASRMPDWSHLVPLLTRRTYSRRSYYPVTCYK